MSGHRHHRSSSFNLIMRWLLLIGSLADCHHPLQTTRYELVIALRSVGNGRPRSYYVNYEGQFWAKVNLQASSSKTNELLEKTPDNYKFMGVNYESCRENFLISGTDQLFEKLAQLDKLAGESLSKAARSNIIKIFENNLELQANETCKNQTKQLMNLEPSDVNEAAQIGINSPKGAQQSSAQSRQNSSNTNPISPTKTDNNNMSLIRSNNASINNNNKQPQHSKDVRFLLDELKPRTFVQELNNLSNITFSEYTQYYAKRLIIFENSTNVYVLIAESRYHYQHESMNLVSILLLLVILVGNCLILVSTRSCRRRRSNVNFFIVHLAIADLLVGIFSMGTDALDRNFTDFRFGYSVCLGYKYLSCLFIFLSTYLVVALGLDRRDAVVYPLSFSSHRNRGTTMVLGAWILSALLALPITFKLDVVEIDSLQQCQIKFTGDGWRYYTLYMLTFVIIIPSVSLIAFYSQIVRTINSKCRQNERLQRDLERQLGTNSNNNNNDDFRVPPATLVAQPASCLNPATTNSNNNLPCTVVNRQHGTSVIPKARLKTIRMTIAIVITYILCWLPFCLINVVKVYGLVDMSHSWIWEKLEAYTNTFCYFNSAVNPLLYFWFSRKGNKTHNKLPPSTSATPHSKP